MRRGDLVTIAYQDGNFTGKPRPAVVIQSDLFHDLSSVTICPLTSIGAESVSRVAVQPSDAAPLLRRSWIEVDKISTMHRRKVGEVIGRLDEADMQRLNSSLLAFLGIG